MALSVPTHTQIKFKKSFSIPTLFFKVWNKTSFDLTPENQKRSLQNTCSLIMVEMLQI